MLHNSHILEVDVFCTDYRDDLFPHNHRGLELQAAACDQQVPSPVCLLCKNKQLL